MAMESSPDHGEWTIHKEGDKVYLFSDDFTHNVKLEVSGDFATPNDKEIYAKSLARWMSERLLDDASDSIKIGCLCSTCRG